MAGTLPTSIVIATGVAFFIVVVLYAAAFPE